MNHSDSLIETAHFDYTDCTPKLRADLTHYCCQPAIYRALSIISPPPILLVLGPPAMNKYLLAFIEQCLYTRPTIDPESGRNTKKNADVAGVAVDKELALIGASGLDDFDALERHEKVSFAAVRNQFVQVPESLTKF